MFSLLSNVLGGDGGGGSSKVDRNDNDAVGGTSSGSDNDLDEALGTLMAYGGKYLRQLGTWAFEYGTQTSADVLNQSALPDPQSVASLLTGNGAAAGAGGGGGAKPYLSTLTQPQLEKIGLKAVEAGANPLSLQSAFVTAQVRYILCCANVKCFLIPYKILARDLFALVLL